MGRCSQCLGETAHRLGYETPAGDTLCGPCYFWLWGQVGEREPAPATERRRPALRRPRRRRPIWIPRPTRDLDPPRNATPD